MYLPVQTGWGGCTDCQSQFLPLLSKWLNVIITTFSMLKNQKLLLRKKQKESDKLAKRDEKLCFEHL